jgi:hypothetical protein
MKQENIEHICRTLLAGEGVKRKLKSKDDPVYYRMIYQVLALFAGAPVSDLEHFVFCLTHAYNRPQEWRFRGSLGLGGKYWRQSNEVTLYQEEMTEERRLVLENVNRALAWMKNQLIKI